MQPNAKAAPASPGVGKKQLCDHLRWARTTLDRRLDQDPNFPVLSRGGQGGGWAFDIAAVDAYLSDGTLTATDSLAEDAPAAVGQQDRATHRGEESARQRKDAAQAALMEDRLRRQRGELVEAGEMQMVVSTMLARLGQSLSALPDAIVRRLNLPESASVQIRDLVDQMRREAVKDLRELLVDE